MLTKIPLLGRLDPFIVGILITVGIASLIPADGTALTAFTWATKVAVGLLFFLYGARLSSQEALHGLRHWRLHVTILAATFVIFPLLGIAARVLVPTVLTQPLYLGLLYVCLLPSTVQSSIAFVSIARGNVPGAIVSASFSNILGIVVTPLLVALLMTSEGAGFDASSAIGILVMLLLPFIAGQVLRRWIGTWVTAHGAPLKLVDRGSILLVVYVAFSEGMNEGIWGTLSVGRLLALLAVCAVLLAIVLSLTWFGSKRLGFDRADQITITFCGSKKSLATGLPMATVLFASQPIGLIVLPLMLFHQLQLLVCAWMAGRLARRAASEEPDLATTSR
ncbi:MULTISPECIES: bile acid:sodium symporter family protein [unclassified Rhodococcus (in: high G+C Gram-positive bacteria)]|uniref:bile acid:sodium symporter family protein n=1 Tax=unclassified Rhodococcus (in: high G+C Gram-positive bacteria) TaxID=192944 RepID=UPI00163A4F5B|nr:MULTISPECIES: bile acid:sodium symporter family protein [unclassified Rhodococcus (in: high G+C Gram-positive bacteria)]MBC2641654.1 bile acid:sodium symporter [Rhodococcus sp. 3A]MBC2893601.1 bile acid:sodium symporter [Rhodococcus sp. 4CII]